MKTIRVLIVLLATFCGVFFATAKAGATTWTGIGTSGNDSYYIGWDATNHVMKLCDVNSGTTTNLQTTQTLDADQTIDLNTGDDEIHIILGQFALGTECGIVLKEVQYNGHTITISGSGGDDIISGGDGDDIISGDDANATTCAGSSSAAGADTLDGKYGTNTVRGCGGNDNVINNCNAPQTDSLYGNLGNDCLYVRSGAATVFDCGGQTLDKRKSLPTGTGCTASTGSCSTTGYGDSC